MGIGLSLPADLQFDHPNSVSRAHNIIMMSMVGTCVGLTQLSAIFQFLHPREVAMQMSVVTIYDKSLILSLSRQTGKF